MAFRVWEIVDVWTLPSRRNEEYRAIKAKVDGPDYYGTRWQVVPLLGSDAQQGRIYGLGLAASF